MRGNVLRSGKIDDLLASGESDTDSDTMPLLAWDYDSEKEGLGGE
jgi:hypothetical protein